MGATGSADDTARIVESIRHGIESMPCNRLLGLRVVLMREGEARVSLAARPEIANHAGTLHAAAQFALVEAAGGAAVTSAFLDLVGRAVPLAEGVDLTWFRAAAGDLAATGSLPPPLASRIRDELAATGSARFRVDVTLTDRSGEVVAEALQRWVLRRLEPAG